ncbi:two component sensor kinase [Clostridia bacterium]|nr:two component sensor kinase [Clostridia bacterium]
MKVNIKNEVKKRFGLTISLVLFVFCVILATMLLAGMLVMILHVTGAIRLGNEMKYEQANGNGFEPFRSILAMMGFSTVMGTAIAAFFSKKALKPIRTVVTATQKIAAGDFNVQLDIGGVYELEELANSFNKMAQELSSIETLRSDFVNNFSHEFKTPIVSVRGFAKLLKDENLTKEERDEYLNIIITESERLSGLSTNVLNLSKYEHMEIIGDKTCFRLDEQIRRTVVMTEAKWAKKEINIDVEMAEIMFNGNEDLIQQIWLNLLDNAIKFSKQGGIIKIRLVEWNSDIRFTICDNGIGFHENAKAKIFEKFYQDDSSRAKEGNGLGLAIVRQIIALCGGTIEVNSELNKGSVFTVILPTSDITLRDNLSGRSG